MKAEQNPVAVKSYRKEEALMTKIIETGDSQLQGKRIASATQPAQLIGEVIFAQIVIFGTTGIRS